MNRTPRSLLSLVSLAILLAACSANLKRGPEPGSYLLALRAEYLASNPDGAYNEYIKRGEVVKGMDFLEVLASWGHPVRRVKQSDTTTERWIYREVDEESKDWVEYTFTFHKNVLDDWSTARHFAGGGSLPISSSSKEEPLAKDAFTTGKRVPK